MKRQCNILTNNLNTRTVYLGLALVFGILVPTTRLTFAGHWIEGEEMDKQLFVGLMRLVATAVGAALVFIAIWGFLSPALQLPVLASIPLAVLGMALVLIFTESPKHRAMRRATASLDDELRALENASGRSIFVAGAQIIEDVSAKTHVFYKPQLRKLRVVEWCMRNRVKAWLIGSAIAIIVFYLLTLLPTSGPSDYSNYYTGI